MKTSSLGEHHDDTTPRRDFDPNPPNVSADSRKRKREVGRVPGVAEATMAHSFTITPCPQSIYEKPYRFTPLTTLSRARLPLSYLDNSPNLVPSNKLFASQIDLLESCDRDDGSIDQSVLIARLDPDKSLYAIEGVSKKIYAVCKLAPWVTADIVERMSVTNQIKHAFQHPQLEVANPTARWWHSTTIAPGNSGASEGSKANAPRISMLRRTDPMIFPRRDPSPVRLAPENPSATIVQPDNVAEEPKVLSSLQVLEALATQYLEALYLSKTSLAFFAKGPLSRARATFSGHEELLQVHSLTVGLRAMLLTLPSMDKKYKEKLPEILRDARWDDVSGDEAIARPIAVLLRRHKLKKQLKLNRDGMYPKEEEVVKRWWRHSDGTHSSPSNETADAAVNRRIADLRQREILAQIIIIMETLSLEASPSYTPQNEHQLEDELINAQALAEGSKLKKRKHKKPQDLKLLLDLLLDKLCIWQSVEQDLGALTTSPPKDMSAVNSSKITNSDKLKDFCTEIIVPFYMNRLPEQASTINRKLGGPKAISPPKKPLTKNPAAHKRPGAPESRLGPLKKPRQPLGRIATESSRHKVMRPPSLARSATDSAIVPGLKHERSDTPLSAIPYQRSPSISNRSSVSQYERFASREVDLSAMSAATAAKRKKKEAIEHQLKQAITTLKRPNRGMAVKEFVDSADLRSQGMGHRGKRHLQPIQVTATPKRARSSKQFTADSIPSQIVAEAIPPSSASFVPSSALRPPPSSYVPGTVIKDRTDNFIESTSGIQETPSRGPSKKVSIFAGAALSRPSDPQTPIRRTSSATAPHMAQPKEPSIARALFQPSSSKPRPAGAVYEGREKSPPQSTRTQREEGTIFATPLKKTAVKDNAGNLTIDLPGGNSQVEVTPEKNIYDALGWNDDDETDDLALI